MSDQLVSRTNLSPKESELVSMIAKSGLINYDVLGRVVSQVSSAVFDPNVAADDYIAKVYSSVIQVWKTSQALPGLEEVAALKNVASEIG